MTIKNINQDFLKLYHAPNVKFTIILGSGLHKHALHNKVSVLSSWDLLLRILDKDVCITKQYHLDFEKIIQEKKLY